MSATIESLGRVLELDFKVLFCGHNPQLSNPKRSLEMKRRQLLMLVEKAGELLGQGMERRKIVDVLCKGQEKHLARWLTLGDASYKNLIDAAIVAAIHKSN